MPLFSYKKRRVIPVLPPTAPSGQIIYDAYTHHASSPPPPFMENKRQSYNNDVQRQLKEEHEDMEKYNHQRFLLDEAEKLNKGRLTYARVFCCCCFPCLPMWTRTICCFIFLGLCGVIGLCVFFVMMFSKPQIMFNGFSPQVVDSLNVNNIMFQFSVYNGNYFEFDFDSIKAVAFFPTPNKTSIGVGEISDLVLGPRSVTNVTFPIQMMGDGYNDSVAIIDGNNNMIQNNSSKHNENAFTNLFISSCNQNNRTELNRQNEKKEITIIFDLIPTIRVYGFPIVSLAFTGQNIKMSCEKLNSFIKSNEQELSNR